MESNKKTTQHEKLTSDGTIRGLVRDGVATYLGVPYGCADGETGGLGALRPTGRWTGTLDCTLTPPVFHQPASRLASIMGNAIDENPRSEQAFTVNIFAPVDASTSPVLVFLHGGA